MISINLKELRKKHHLTQQELAQKAGLTFSLLTKIEQGVTPNPTLKTLIKLADAFKINIDELVGRKNDQ